MWRVDNVDPTQTDEYEYDAACELCATCSMCEWWTCEEENDVPMDGPVP